MRGSFLLTGGVAFAFMNLAKQFPEDTGDRSALLESAAELLDSNLKYLDQPNVKRDRQMQIGFLLGATGVHVTIYFLFLDGLQCLDVFPATMGEISRGG